MEPIVINAAYSPQDNSITIPAGILRLPYYHSDLPMSLNYGAIGSVVGHELTHCLDNEGRYFDYQGNYLDEIHLNEWPLESVEKFKQRSECLIKQYSNINDSVTGLMLNGDQTLDENIADNGGLRSAFWAFQKHYQKQNQLKNSDHHDDGHGELLPDLPQFNPEQLFFISNAQIWCRMVRPEMEAENILHNLHAPSRYRVNIPMSNFPEFARVFQCPKGSPMNPEQKCLLW